MTNIRQGSPQYQCRLHKPDYTLTKSTQKEINSPWVNFLRQLLFSDSQPELEPSCRGLRAVCVVHKLASGWHPFAPAAHTASLPHWPCLLLAAGFPWQPQSVHTTPLSLPLSRSLSIPLSLPKPGRTCILPFPDSPIHQHKAGPGSVLSTLYVCHRACVCVCVYGGRAQQI